MGFIIQFTANGKQFFARKVSFIEEMQFIICQKQLADWLPIRRELNSPAPNFQAKFTHFIINQRMTSENIWVMIYVMPQFNCFGTQILNPLENTSLSIVESSKGQIEKEMIKTYNHSSLQIKRKQLPVSATLHERYKEDSSFFIPMKQENKTSQQKLGRNSVSNILRLFTKYLKGTTVRQNYGKIKQKLSLEFNFKQFNSWTTGIGLNTNKYIRIKKVLSGIKSKPNFGRILSILYYKFMSEFSRAAILTSAKTQSKNISPTLFQIRNILDEFNDAVREGGVLTSKKN